MGLPVHFRNLCSFPWQKEKQANLNHHTVPLQTSLFSSLFLAHLRDLQFTIWSQSFPFTVTCSVVSESMTVVWWHQCASGCCSLSPLWSIPKPCSVFIDAVYFVHYQINNKTQPWPEEQKRKVIHTWVESIYIRTMSALSILWVPACIFGIMHLCNIKSKMFIRRGFITGQKEQPVPLMFLERSPSPPPSLFFGLEIGWEPTHIFSKCLHDRNRLGRRLNTVSGCIYWGH